MKITPTIKTVTVVEKNKDVINLISSAVRSTEHDWSKVQIIHDDFWRFVENDDDREKRDWVFVDLWVSSNKEEKEMLYTNEVLPSYFRLHFATYPRAKFVFHGFQKVSDVKLVNAKTLEELREMAEISKELNIKG